MRSNTFDRLSFLSLFIVVVLLPFFCLPFTNIPVETSKGLLLVLGLAACMVFWAIARFLDGRVVLPKSWLLLSGFGIVLVFLLSSLFSAGSEVSLFGTMFDLGSFWFIFSAFILMLLSSIVFRTPKQARIVLLGAILSSAFVLIFQGARLLIPTTTGIKFIDAITSLGILANKTGNVLGSWNALGLFAGFSALMFLLVVEFFPVSKIRKIFLEIFILLSILLVACVNFSLVWIILGISSLIIFVYKVSLALDNREDEGTKRSFPIISFIVVMVSLLFFMSSGRFIATFIPNHLQVSNTEVSPSFSATMSITKGVLSKNPVFGTGPNRFGEAWSLYKPSAINTTQLWDVTFDSGSGLLPTLTATSGLLGIIAWLVFFILFLVFGIKSLFYSIKKKVNWEMMSFFVLSLYLFISSFFYFTGTAMFLLAFAFTGVFIGLNSSILKKEISMSFLNDHRKSFFSILVLIFLVILSVALSFKYVERFASISYFGKSINAGTEPIAEDFIGKALSLYTNDLYLRTASQIFLVKANLIVGKSGTPSDGDKTDLQTSLTQAVTSAQMSASYDPRNYLNFQLLGSVYQALGSFGVKDAYGNAILAYQTASNLNPLNPGLKLDIARAEFFNGKVQDAKDYANAALTLKPDYIDALITLSQIAKSEGDSSGALSYAQAALALSPNDKSLIQYIDSLNSSAPIPSSAPSKTKK
jgi:hypothetical protein